MNTSFDAPIASDLVGNVDADGAAVAPVADDLHLICRAGDAEYAIAARDVVEMETYTGATPVPGTAGWIVGIVQVRGRVVPAIDLRARFGLPTTARSLDTRVVLIELGARVVGIVVDAAREVIRLPAETLQASAADDVVGAGFVRGTAAVGDRLFFLIDLASLLGQELSHGGPTRQHR